ncbi:UPF0213 protein VPA1222 [Frankliniella fusca]|uniref:UPF0213 protein VPA1222 n=1 Tax=Frankliniella fusca TaxID=407009 RepID=A0AAE1HND9_9NEOP|nr:UPF0213 protein VPA1222 [Frankliniella fusca]
MRAEWRRRWRSDLPSGDQSGDLTCRVATSGDLALAAGRAETWPPWFLELLRPGRPLGGLRIRIRVLYGTIGSAYPVFYESVTPRKNMKIEKHDDVWKALLAVIEILEIILSPVIHDRRDLFPDVQLRPKHHYLSHASELIKCFGPLVRVFTLRFEAKHQFFKRAMKSSKNSINPLKSLAVRHELFLAFVRTGADFRCDIQVFGDSEFIQHAVLHYNLDQSRECVRAIVKGTTYQKGNVVVIRQAGYQNLVELGSIVLIIYDNNDKLYLLLQKKKSEFVPHLRVYELHSTLSYECVCVDDLFSHQSLYVYKINGHQFVKLKHAVVCDRFE